ncbi:MAG: hypothetical protein PHE55_15285, partial [Methylococcaceae bacterium]|nr:hypothetical protein [Methylococcaceae bacterium]
MGLLEDSRFAARESQGHGCGVYPLLKTHSVQTGKLEDAINDPAAHFARGKPAKCEAAAPPSSVAACLSNGASFGRKGAADGSNGASSASNGAAVRSNGSSPA